MSLLPIAPLTWQFLQRVMTSVKPIPAFLIVVAAASSLWAKEESASLPPPVSDKTYTFQQIEKQKAQLKDKVIRIEIASLVAGPGDDLADGTQRYIVEDTSKGATPFGQVAFSRGALEKMGRKGPFTIYARVHVFPEKEAAAFCVAVGTHVGVENGKATYSW